MICPRCDSKLEVVHIDSEDIKVCKSCGGMWLHKNQLNMLLGEQQGDIELCSIADHSHDDEQKMKCLECDDTDMRRIEFLEYSGIILNHCDSCGSFWVDKDEIKNMRDHIEKVNIGSNDVKEPIAYNLLKKLSELAFSIFK